ncbi:haloacid dehalogenase-like hydrolase domain-containing protein [Scenedesmus sp. PABB004]|nr:haloacid dehalogenase-like hydrolase domain-containing protein [Scenedesmus sp. PABB004]
MRAAAAVSVRRWTSPAHRQLAMATSSAASGAEAQQHKRIVRGVVFDMDGTLTVPVIDFQYMRQRVGVGPTGDILDVIASWPPEEQAAAHAAIAEIEEQALRDMQAMPGLVELCSWLDGAGIPRGLITRNVLASVRYFHDHHLPLPPFVPAISRECAHPYKPSPAALLHICSVWGIAPGEVVMVGDSKADDVVCGNRAGAVSVLLDTQGRFTGLDDPQLQGECAPAAIVRSLTEFQALLAQAFDCRPPERAA